MFGEGSSHFFRMLVLGSVVLAIILIGRFTDWLDPVREQLGALAEPFLYIADAPSRASEWIGEQTQSRSELLDTNRRQAEELLILKGKLHRMASLISQNLDLQQLLDSADMLQDRVLVAELIGILPDPNVHVVVVNKGRRHGVYIGQPLLDDKGLMGQVISITPSTAHVLLITDTTHAIPVQVNRNGVRSVVEGIGDLYEMRLRHVSSTMDIAVGDELVSSGLGQRFPIGYPVAYVESITYDPGEPFATVKVKPAADLNRSRSVLFVFSKRSEDAPVEIPSYTPSIPEG